MGARRSGMRFDDHRTWQYYCGFLDLSLVEFMEIQEYLLAEELAKVAPSGLGRRLWGTTAPTNLAELRQVLAPTTFEDYRCIMEERQEELLPEPPYLWAHTSGLQGSFKGVPYTRRAFETLLNHVTALFMLACSPGRGVTELRPNDRVLYNLPPRPYLTGYVLQGMAQRTSLRSVLPVEGVEEMDFVARIEEGFQRALKDGVDVIVSLSSVLLKMGERMTQLSREKHHPMSLRHPLVLLRLATALMRSKLERRPLLPRDLWPAKTVICWGIDTDLFLDKLTMYWGCVPYQFYACTEAGVIAVQSWRKGGLVFLPTSVFLEFIPEEEWRKGRLNGGSNPRTILLNEVEPGRRYELVITSFYGMPLLRYRVGHLVRVVAREDAAAHIRLPHIVFEGRADDLIDIAGFARLDEGTVTAALRQARLAWRDWVLRKEAEQGRPVLHLYLELEPASDHHDHLAQRLHTALIACDPFYRDLDQMLEIRPLRVTLLPEGAFQRYRESNNGQASAMVRPVPRMNPPREVVQGLLGANAR